jgi:REP-associated tyrosine transposase
MPRPPRDTAAGIFHIFTHCVWGVPSLYRDDVDRLEFLRHLARVSSRTDLACMAYCLMGSHYHLIVEVDDGALPPSMHSLNLAYARAFNNRYSLRGHVQFDRYGSRRIYDEEDLLGRYAYVANNPVRAGLCTSAEEWPWSSFAGTIGLAPAQPFVDPSRVLRCFDWPRVDPRAALRQRVTES